MQSPEGEIRKESPVKQLWERNREERKETNRKPSTRTCKSGMRDQVEVKRESVEAKAKTSTRGNRCGVNLVRTERKTQRAE